MSRRMEDFLFYTCAVLGVALMFVGWIWYAVSA